MIPLLVLAVLAVAVDVMAVLNSPLAVPVIGLLIAAFIGILIRALYMVGDKIDAHADTVAATKPTEAKAEHAAAWLARQVADFLKANGQDEKALANPATRAAAEAHLLDAMKAQAKSVVDSAIAKTALVLLCVGLAFSACAHLDPIVQTGISLDAAKPVVVATSHAMDAAVKTHRITPEAYAKWQTALADFQAGWDLAFAEWKSAKLQQNATKSQQIAAALGVLMANVGTFEAMILPPPQQADGGAP